MKTIVAFWVLFFTYSVGLSQPEMNYPQEHFDSQTCCWRQLAAEGKYGQAANLILTYLKKGKVANKHSLNWHAAQMFAMAGNDKQAIRYANKTYNLFYRGFGGSEGRAWYFFAKGTKAFLKRDKKELERLLHCWEEKELPKDKNFEELTKLLTNWDKSYKEATTKLVSSF